VDCVYSICCALWSSSLGTTADSTSSVNQACLRCGRHLPSPRKRLRSFETPLWDRFQSLASSITLSLQLRQIYAVNQCITLSQQSTSVGNSELKHRRYFSIFLGRQAYMDFTIKRWANPESHIVRWSTPWVSQSHFNSGTSLSIHIQGFGQQTNSHIPSITLRAFQTVYTPLRHVWRRCQSHVETNISTFSSPFFRSTSFTHLVVGTFALPGRRLAVRWRVVTSSTAALAAVTSKVPSTDRRAVVQTCFPVPSSPAAISTRLNHWTTPFLLHNNIYTYYSSYVLLKSLCMLILKIFIILI